MQCFFLSFTEYDCEKRETSQNNDSCSQTHHRVTTTQTYPTETRTERDNLLNTMMLMHLDIDLLGLSKGGDGKRTNKNNKKIANLNFNGGWGMHVQCKKKQPTKQENNSTKYIIKNKKGTGTGTFLQEIRKNSKEVQRKSFHWYNTFL